MNYVVLTLLLVYCQVFCTNGNNSLKDSYLEEHEGVVYQTYTKDNPQDWVNIRDVDFNDIYSNVFIIHGFASVLLDKPLKVKDDLFQYNQNVKRVIVIDWQDYSRGTGSSNNNQDPYNTVASENVPLLAQDLYEKIVHIRKNGARTIELIGHSVGCHVAGQTGRLLKDDPVPDPVDQIYGLDPAGTYFSERDELVLQNTDAKNVLVIHTNINRYGFGSEIGTNDIKANGGERQPNCKLNVDFCSHNEAWNAFSDYLSGNIKTMKNAEIHPYVICLDISGSMDDNKRLPRAVNSAQKVISNLKSGAFIGIVTFNHEARIVHDIIEIKNKDDINSLLSSLPTECSGSTSIGSGLRLSMDILNVLKAMRNMTQFCSTIVLVSDGEQMVGESPLHVLTDLQNECIKVSSIALGRYASNDLEKLSTLTKGENSYAIEDGTCEDIVGVTKAFSYVFENQIDDDIVHLPTKEITLTGGVGKIDYIIDDTTGKDTEFKYVSYEIAQLDVILKSPNGQVFTSSSSEYFFDYFAEKGFLIPKAIPGTWSLTVTKIAKRKRSVRSTISVTAIGQTHQLNDRPTIRLGAVVSHLVLEYPKPITISAELRSGEFPIVNAGVYANIRAPNQPIIRLEMYDNGIFPDELANDGIYTTEVRKLPKPERYSVIVTARSNGTAMLVPKKIDYFTKDIVDCKSISCTKLNEFEREADAGAIKLSSTKNENKIPPSKVDDLRGMIENEREKLIALEWTSPNDDVFDIKVKHYDIRALINGTNFENGLKFNANDLVQGSLEAGNSITTKDEKVVIKIPDHIWNSVVQSLRPQYWQLRFALKSIGLNGEISERSNIASVVVRKRSFNRSTIAPIASILPVLVVEEDPVYLTISEKKICKTIFWEHSIGNVKVKFC